jgi:hypothetical protein
MTRQRMVKWGESPFVNHIEAAAWGAPMSYTDFTLDTVSSVLGITAEPADLFDAAPASPVSDWLRATLERGVRQILLTEKARSEFIVTPVLLECQEVSAVPVSIYSGPRLDVDPDRGLVGECDFILAATQPVPALRAPLVIVVEAKRHDVESGIWQCVAQMVGARLFNERSGRSLDAMYGCVTNGDVWRFVRLMGQSAGIDRRRYYLDNVGAIIAAFQHILADAGAAPRAA